MFIYSIQKQINCACSMHGLNQRCIKILCSHKSQEKITLRAPYTLS